MTTDMLLDSEHQLLVHLEGSSKPIAISLSDLVLSVTPADISRLHSEQNKAAQNASVNDGQEVNQLQEVSTFVEFDEEERIPAVYTMPREQQHAVTIVDDELVHNCAHNRTIVDTGSIMNLISKALVDELCLPYTKEGKASMLVSTGSTSSTLGKLTGSTKLVLGYEQPHAAEVVQTVHVVDGVEGKYDLHLGAPFLNALGCEISAFSSTLTYRPELPTTGKGNRTHTQPLVTSLPSPIMHPAVHNLHCQGEVDMVGEEADDGVEAWSDVTLVTLSGTPAVVCQDAECCSCSVV